MDKIVAAASGIERIVSNSVPNVSWLDAQRENEVGSLAGADTIRFEDVSGAAGISPRQTLTFGNPNWGDLNNDGYLDLIVPVAGWLPFVYINNGNGTFTQSLNSAIEFDPNEYHDWHGQALGDVDNDGCLDVYQTNGAERGQLVGAKTDSLFQGLGNATFVNITTSAGTQNAFGRGRSAFWVDYDNDGLLDIFVKNINTKNALYHNNGDGTFTDKAASAGLADLLDGWVVSFADYDRDGYMDLVISGKTCRLLHNEGDGTFRDVTAAAGIEHRIRAEGVAWGDYNNDGYLDLFVTCGATKIVPPGALTPVLYHNNGDGTFTDVTTRAGLNADTNSYSAVWGDFDNDGYLDLFVPAIGFGNGPNANRLYYNNGDGTFTDVAESTGLQLNDGVSPHLGASWGDYDNDGFLDLVIKNGLAYGLKGQARLFHNSGSRYPGKLIVQKNSLSAITPLPGQGDFFKVLWDNRPDIAGQMLWFSFGDPNCRNNGGHMPCDPEVTLRKSIDIGLRYGMRYIEIYQRDVMNLPDVIHYAHDAMTK